MYFPIPSPRMQDSYESRNVSWGGHGLMRQVLMLPCAPELPAWVHVCPVLGRARAGGWT